MELRNPYVRVHVVDAIDGLADTGRHQQWPAEVDNFQEVIHVLYDDTDLWPKPEVAIGDLLWNQAEAEAIRGVLKALDVVLARYGTDLPDQRYIAAPEWGQVVKAAQAAAEVLHKDGA